MEEPYPYATFTPNEVAALFEAREALQEGRINEGREILNSILSDWESRYSQQHESRQK